MDKRNHIGVILMDLSKAFDAINHSLMLTKLEAYAFSLTSLKLMQSFLCKRFQINLINGPFSNWTEIRSSSGFYFRLAQKNWDYNLLRKFGLYRANSGLGWLNTSKWTMQFTNNPSPRYLYIVPIYQDNLPKFPNNSEKALSRLTNFKCFAPTKLKCYIQKDGFHIPYIWFS